MSEFLSSGEALGRLDRHLLQLRELAQMVVNEISQAYDRDLAMLFARFAARRGGDVSRGDIDVPTDNERVRATSLIRARNVLGDVVRTLDRALALVDAVNADGGLEDSIERYYRARGLLNELEQARSLANAIVKRDHERNELLDRGLTYYYDLASDSYLADRLVRAVDGAVAHVNAVRSLKPVGVPRVAEPQGSSSRWSIRLARLSVRVLPAQERGRYAEEFGSELFELRGEPWRRQLMYGTRLFLRSVALRWALRQPSPGSPVRQRVW